MPLQTYKIEATHRVTAEADYEIEKEKAGMTLEVAEMMARKWAKAGYHVFVMDESTGECVAKAPPAEGD